jgi:hypothetical protein
MPWSSTCPGSHQRPKLGTDPHRIVFQIKDATDHSLLRPQCETGLGAGGRNE